MTQMSHDIVTLIFNRIYCAIYSFWAVYRISTYQVIALTKLVENLVLRTELHGRYPKTYETASAVADGDREDEES